MGRKRASPCSTSTFICWVDVRFPGHPAELRTRQLRSSQSQVTTPARTGTGLAVPVPCARTGALSRRHLRLALPPLEGALLSPAARASALALVRRRAAPVRGGQRHVLLADAAGGLPGVARGGSTGI